MKKFTAILVLVVMCLAACVFFTGCTDSSTPAASEPSVSATTAAASSALYKAGDIVKNPASTSPIAVLIIKYDTAADSYERAYIYPNSDGSWGYRMDSNTVTVSRANIEKIYTQKISNMAVSSVPVSAPTTSTAVVTQTTSSVATTSTTSTTTTTLGLAPKVKGIEPDKGTAATTVTITELTGQNFVSPANVSLKKGSTTIAATDVKLDALGIISCKIAIPAGTTGGYWDVIVTNPDKQYGSYQNGFYIVASDVTATATTTTAPAVNTLVKITQIQDTLLVTGGTETSKEVTVLGTNLSAASKMKLIKGSTTITSTGYIPSGGNAKGIFIIPAGNLGDYYVSVTDSGDTVLATSSGTLKIQ
jgi:hypothetical protein